MTSLFSSHPFLVRSLWCTANTAADFLEIFLPTTMPSGIDYSKWDHLEVSDSEDEEDDGPRVTRLEQPSRVTLSPSGEVAIATGAASKKAPTRPAVTNAPASSSSSTIPQAWTEKGGITKLAHNNTSLVWTQDRTSVTLRFALSTNQKKWQVTLRGQLSYADRHVGVSSTTKATLAVQNDSQSLLPPTALPYPVHAAQDDEDGDAVDWTMERAPNNQAYLCVTLYKAVPMEGVVVWWSRPLEGTDEITLDWRDTPATSKFQEAWDQAHQQFREKLQSQKNEEGESH